MKTRVNGKAHHKALRQYSPFGSFIVKPWDINLTPGWRPAKDAKLETPHNLKKFFGSSKLLVSANMHFTPAFIRPPVFGFAIDSIQPQPKTTADGVIATSGGAALGALTAGSLALISSSTFVLPWTLVGAGIGGALLGGIMFTIDAPFRRDLVHVALAYAAGGQTVGNLVFADRFSRAFNMPFKNFWK